MSSSIVFKTFGSLAMIQAALFSPKTLFISDSSANPAQAFQFFVDILCFVGVAVSYDKLVKDEQSVLVAEEQDRNWISVRGLLDGIPDITGLYFDLLNMPLL